MPNTQGLAVTHDVDVPQRGFDDFEGADVTFFDPVVHQECPPAPSEHATIPRHQEAHLPWPEAMILIRRSPERDIRGPAEPGRLPEIPRNRLQ